MKKITEESSPEEDYSGFAAQDNPDCFEQYQSIMMH